MRNGFTYESLEKKVTYHKSYWSIRSNKHFLIFKSLSVECGLNTACVKIFKKSAGDTFY